MTSIIVRIVIASALGLGTAVGISVGPTNATDAATNASADYYLNAICPANRSQDKAAKALLRMDKKGWEEGDRVPRYAKRALRKASRATARAGRMVAQYDWPENVSSYDSEGVAENLYGYSTWFAPLAKGNFRAATPNNSSDAANSMRMALGLGPAGTEDDGC